jgi:hypothetical protein
MRGSADADDGKNGVAAGSAADGIGRLGPVALEVLFLRWATRSGGRMPTLGRLSLTTSRSP